MVKTALRFCEAAFFAVRDFREAPAVERDGYAEANANHLEHCSDTEHRLDGGWFRCCRADRARR